MTPQPSATPLAKMKFDAVFANNTNELMAGLTTGSVGETCGVLIPAGRYLPGGAQHDELAHSRSRYFLTGGGDDLDLPADTIPQTYPGPMFMLFSGGLMLGAIFMATDMVASPITNAGCWLYGFLIAILVVVIRFWGGMPEGVMYAILLANAASPHIDNLIRPRVFGTGGKAQ